MAPRKEFQTSDTRKGRIRRDSAVGDKCVFDALGTDVWRFLKVLVLFHDIGLAFRQGAKSLADVVAWLDERDLAGLNKHGVCCSPASVTRQCKVAKRLFGRVFCPGDAVALFRDNGPGHPINGLTPLGDRAWELTHAYLVSRGMVEEKR